MDVQNRIWREYGHKGQMPSQSGKLSWGHSRSFIFQNKLAGP